MMSAPPRHCSTGARSVMRRSTLGYSAHDLARCAFARGHADCGSSCVVGLRSDLAGGQRGGAGAGKTALVERLCKKMRDDYDIAVVTNDIYTKEDAEFLTRAGALAPERIVGVETGGCPHTAIREDASINLAAVSDIVRKWPKLEIVFVESGGDNLAATFSPELADLTIYVSDVAAGEKIP